MSATSLRWIAPLLFAVTACDASEPGPDVELRDGQTVQFKTTNTDQSFTWKGCEPPWGPDPYPDEKWLAEVATHVQRDVGVNALSSWRNTESSHECDEGCSSLELAWTGDARPVEPAHELGKVNPIGHCDEDLVAVEIEVEVDTAFACACK